MKVYNETISSLDDRLCTKRCCIRCFGNCSCFFSLLLGLCTLGVSVMAIFTHSEASKSFGAILYYYGMYGVLFASLCTVWVAMLGLCGMSAKNRFLVLTLVGGCFILIISLLISILFVLAFPYSSPENLKAVMLDTLKQSYGTLGLTTVAWDYVQSYLLCCAVDDNGWLAWKGSEWYMDENSLLYDDTKMIQESNPDFKMVPKSCCYRKLDYLTRQLTNKYEDLGRCQNWQYGPPKFGCFPTMKAYISRFSFWIAVFGTSMLLFLICSLAVGIRTLVLTSTS